MLRTRTCRPCNNAQISNARVCTRAAPTSYSLTASKRTTSQTTPSRRTRLQSSVRSNNGLKIISREEVAQHNTKDDCWMIIHNKVYDVSRFVDAHPGGEIIAEGAGKEATNLFEENNHSEDARDMLEDYIIGILPPDQHEMHK